MPDYKTLLVYVWCLKMLDEDFLREVSGQRLQFWSGFSSLIACVSFIQTHVAAMDKDTPGPVTTGTLHKKKNHMAMLHRASMVALCVLPKSCIKCRRVTLEDE